MILQIVVQLFDGQNARTVHYTMNTEDLEAGIEKLQVELDRLWRIRFEAISAQHAIYKQCDENEERAEREKNPAYDAACRATDKAITDLEVIEDQYHTLQAALFKAQRVHNPDEFDELISGLSYRLFYDACFENTYGRSRVWPPEFVDFSNVTPEELQAFLKRLQDRWEKDPLEPNDEDLARPDFAKWDKIV